MHEPEAPLLQLQRCSTVRDNTSTGKFPFPMAENIEPPVGVDANTSAGHLSVHVEGLHPHDVPFLFEQQPKRMGLSLLASAAFDILMATLLILASRYAPAATATFLPDQLNNSIVFLPVPGPGGGGGGGGNQMKEPPRQAQLPGKDKLTVPVEKPPTLEPPKKPKDEPNPDEQLIMPAKLLASAEASTAGIIDTGPSTESQGAGKAGGAGAGTGTGIGPGTGSGLGPGSGGGTGGGLFRTVSGASDGIPMS